MIEEQNSLIEKFLKKGFWLYFFTFITAPLSYIIKVIVSNELGVAEVGIIYGVMSLMVLASSFNDFGIKESLNKFIPDYIVKNDYAKVKRVLGYAIIIQIITGSLIFLLFYFGSSVIGKYYFNDPSSVDIIKIFAFFFLGNTFFQVLSTFFVAVQNTFYYKLLDFLRMSFNLIFTISIWFVGSSSMFNYSLSWVVSMYFGVFIASILFYRGYFLKYLKTIRADFSKALFKKIFRYAVIVFVGTQASVILSQIDMQMIIYLLGTVDAGYYTIYLSLINLPVLLIGPIFAFLLPVFSELIAKNQDEKIKVFKSMFVKYFITFSIVISIIMFVFAEVIAIIFFGEKFLPSGMILRYSIFFLIFNFLLQVNFSIMASNGQIVDRLKIILIAIVFNGVFNYIFIKTIGVRGAALATGMGWLLIFMLSEIKLKRYIAKLDIVYLLKNIGLFGIIGLGLYMYILPLFIDINSRIYLLLYMGIIGSIYFIVFMIINIRDFKNFYLQIKNIKGN